MNDEIIDESPDMVIPSQTVDTMKMPEESVQLSSEMSIDMSNHMNTEVIDEEQSIPLSSTMITENDEANEEVEEQSLIAEEQQEAPPAEEAEQQPEAEKEQEEEANNSSEDEHNDREVDDDSDNSPKVRRKRTNKREQQKQAKAERVKQELQDKVYAHFKRNRDMKELIKKFRKDRVFEKKDYLQTMNDLKAVTRQNPIAVTRPVLTADEVVDFEVEPLVKPSTVPLQLPSQTPATTVITEDPIFGNLDESSDDSDDDFELVVVKKIDVVHKVESMDTDDDNDPDAEEGDEEEDEEEEEEEDILQHKLTAATEQVEEDDEEMTENPVEEAKEQNVEKQVNEAIRSDDLESVIAPTLDEPLPGATLLVAPTLDEELPGNEQMTEQIITTGAAQGTSDEDNQLGGAGLTFAEDDQSENTNHSVEHTAENEDNEDQDHKDADEENDLEQREKAALEKEKKLKSAMTKEWLLEKAQEEDYVEDECEEGSEDEDENGNTVKISLKREEKERPMTADEMKELADFVVVNEELAEIDEERAQLERDRSEEAEEVLDENDMMEEGDDVEDEELENWNDNKCYPSNVGFNIPASSADAQEVLKQISTSQNIFSKRSADLLKHNYKLIQDKEVGILQAISAEQSKQEMLREEQERLAEERKKNTKRLLDNFKLIKKRIQKRVSLPESSFTPPKVQRQSRYEAEDDEPVYDGIEFESSDDEEEEKDEEAYVVIRVDESDEEDSRTAAPTMLLPIPEEEETTAQTSSQTFTSSQPTVSLPAKPISIFSSSLDGLDKENRWGDLHSDVNLKKRKRDTADTEDENAAKKQKKHTSMTMHGNRILARGSFLNRDVASNDRAKQFAKKYKKTQKKQMAI